MWLRLTSWRRCRHKLPYVCFLNAAGAVGIARLTPAQFRSFQAGDIDELKRLFALWFPVSYKDVRDAASVCVGTQC